jgi:archaellum component FlaC
LFGSHVHGEYRRDSQPERESLSVLLKQTGAADSLDMALAGSDTKRCGGVARVSDRSIYLDGKDIPFFVGDCLNDAPNTTVPPPEGEPAPTEAVSKARVAFHPLRPDLWLVVFCHVLSVSSGHATLMRTEVWHFRAGPEQTLAARHDSSEQARHIQEKPIPALDLVDLEARLADIENELEKKRREHEEVAGELDDAKDNLDNVNDEIDDLDFVSFGIKGISRSVESGSELCPFNGGTRQKIYTALLDMMEQVQELEGEVEALQADIDCLEQDASDIEERLEQGYSDWAENEYRKAERAVERASQRPPLPAVQLLSDGALACLSEDARRILETYSRWEQICAKESDLQNLDCGPLVVTMSKVCERILADFLGPRCRTIYADPSVSSLLNDPKYTVDIPTEDQSFKIDKGSLLKVLGLIKKPGPLFWSGIRNGAIALLLFGRTYKVGKGAGEEINNPLKVHGDEEERQELRLDLYRLQQLRNGFIHHELAGWTQAQEVKRCFEGCLRRLVSILFGVSPL